MRRSTSCASPRRRLRRWFVRAGGAALAVAASLAGCERGESAAAPTADDGHRAVAPDASSPRIVSLSPALTAGVVALGLGDHVVGRTPWCDAVASTVPIAGDLNEFDAQALVRLRPTHLLVQPPRTGLDPALAALAAEQGWTLFAEPLDDVADIRRVLAALPAVLGATDATRRAELERRAAALDASIVAALEDRGSAAAAAAASPVLLLFSVDPPRAFGPGSYLGDVLERLGGVNALTVRGYPELSMEDLLRLDPRTIVLVRTAPLDGDADPLTAMRSLDLAAARAGTMQVLAHPAALTPGPAVADVARALAAVLQESASRALGTERPSAPGAPERPGTSGSSDSRGMPGPRGGGATAR